MKHANDMALASYKVNGVDCYFMYVVAYDGNVPQNAIVKLQYSGTNYWEVGRYYYPGGADSYTVYSGISNMGSEKDAYGNDGFKFLLKVGDVFSTVVIPYGQGNGTTLSKTTNKFVKDAFSIDRNLTNYANYISQGLHYEADKIYVNYWGGSSKPHANVILVYKNIGSGSPPLDKSREIDKGSSSNVKFEIESCGFPKNQNVFWFNTTEGNYNPYENVNGGIYTDSQNIK